MTIQDIQKVTLSEAAARRVAEIVAAEPSKTALRVSVEGGGCSGFSYKFDLVDDQQDDDLVLGGESGKVLIDGPELPDPQSERDRVLWLRHQLLDLNG
jgi:iron-sulfur cluster assembly accessory protein